MDKPIPPVDHAEAYARELLKQQKIRAKKLDIIGMGHQIRKLCLERMRAARDSGMTHFTNFETDLDNGVLALIGETDSHASCIARATLYPRKPGFDRLVMRSSLWLLGRDRFCENLASDLCSALARQEALALHRRGGEPPPGALAVAERDLLAKAAPASVAPSKPASRL